MFITFSLCFWSTVFIVQQLLLQKQGEIIADLRMLCVRLTYLIINLKFIIADLKRKSEDFWVFCRRSASYTADLRCYFPPRIQCWRLKSSRETPSNWHAPIRKWEDNYQDLLPDSYPGTLGFFGSMVFLGDNTTNLEILEKLTKCCDLGCRGGDKREVVERTQSHY